MQWKSRLMREYTRGGETPQVDDDIAWRGMYTSFAEAPSQAQLAHYCLNCRPLDTKTAGPIWSRSGVANLGAAAPPGTAVLCLFQFYTPVGVQVTGRVMNDAGAGGAHIDTFNFATGVWTTVVAASVLSSAGLNLAGVAQIFWVPYTGQIVFSGDQVNTPWMWDGTTGAGITRLTNAPIAYGKPQIYFGKLMLIVNSDRNTIQWCEENQPNVGYTAGGFSNSWTLTQQGSEPLIGLCATNTALVYFRINSIGAIRGAVSVNWSTSGVQDAVTTQIGCGDFRSIVRVGQEIWFMDTNNRLYFIPPGASSPPVEITPLEPRPSTFAQADPFGFGSEGWYRPPPAIATSPIRCNAVCFTQAFGSGAGSGTQQVWFALQGVTAANEDVCVLAFDGETHLAVGYYVFPQTIHCIEHVEYGANGGDVVVFANPNVGGQANACMVFGQTRTATDLSWNGSAWVEVAINCMFIDSPKAVYTDVETIVNRIDVIAAVDAIGQITVNFNAQFLSSELPSSGVALAAQTQGIAGQVYQERHFAYGVATVCRWFRAVMTWSFGTPTSLGYGAGIKALRVGSQPIARAPSLA